MKLLVRVSRLHGVRAFSIRTVVVAPSSGSSVPTVPAVASSALRRAALEDLPTPRSLEEPFVERARGTASGIFFILIAGAVALIYAATREHSPAIDAKRMTAAAEALRAARVRARAALLAATTASGSIAVGLADGGQRLKWWASGPANAKTVVVFGAESGESAAVWGSVHAELAARVAGSSVRVVSFHRAGALPRAPGVAAPLSLYLRDTDVLLAALYEEAQTEASAERGWRAWFFPAASASRPRVVFVGSGESAWGALTAAGLRAPAAPTADAVLVAPVLFYRGRLMAWLDAITGASKVPYEDDPGLLTRLLDAPNVDVSPSLQEALDASAPRRKAMVSFFSDFGAPGATEAMRVRFSEDFRRARSGVSVLSSAEQSVVSACATALQRSGSRARVLTFGPQTHPSWVHDSMRIGVQALWLLSALAVGVRQRLTLMSVSAALYLHSNVLSPVSLLLTDFHGRKRCRWRVYICSYHRATERNRGSNKGGRGLLCWQWVHCGRKRGLAHAHTFFAASRCARACAAPTNSGIKIVLAPNARGSITPRRLFTLVARPSRRRDGDGPRQYPLAKASSSRRRGDWLLIAPHPKASSSCRRGLAAYSAASTRTRHRISVSSVGAAFPSPALTFRVSFATSAAVARDRSSRSIASPTRARNRLRSFRRSRAFVRAFRSNLVSSRTVRASFLCCHRAPPRAKYAAIFAGGTYVTALTAAAGVSFTPGVGGLVARLVFKISGHGIVAPLRLLIRTFSPVGV